MFHNLKIDDKVIQDGRMIISWDEFDKYNAVKIKDLTTAYQIDTAYLSRSKIEYVLIFLKERLGWENYRFGHLKQYKDCYQYVFMQLLIFMR